MKAMICTRGPLMAPWLPWLPWLLHHILEKQVKTSVFSKPWKCLAFFTSHRLPRQRKNRCFYLLFQCVMKQSKDSILLAPFTHFFSFKSKIFRFFFFFFFVVFGFRGKTRCYSNVLLASPCLLRCSQPPVSLTYVLALCLVSLPGSKYVYFICSIHPIDS